MDEVEIDASFDEAAQLEAIFRVFSDPEIRPDPSDPQAEISIEPHVQSLLDFLTSAHPPNREQLKKFLHPDDGPVPLSAQAIIASVRDHRTVPAVLETLAECGREARTFTVNRLEELVAGFCSKYNAPTSWLFVVREPDKLVAVVRRKTRRSDSVLLMSDPSVSTWVAARKQPFWSNDALNQVSEPCFRASVPESRSIVSVPICDTNGRVVAVLTLESHLQDRFHEALMNDLREEATELLPHLLVLESLDRLDADWCPWHPRCHRWDLVKIARRLCHSARKALDGEHSDGMDVVIWTVDRKHGELYVYATSGHAMSYIKSDVLTMASFTGGVAASGRETVGQARLTGVESSQLRERYPVDWSEPRPGRAFHWTDNARASGIKAVTAAPIFLEGSEGNPGEAEFVVSVYAGGELSTTALPSNDEMIELASTLGQLFSAYEQQRVQLSLAYLSQIGRSTRPDRRLAKLAKNLKEYLRLDEVLFYCETAPDDELVRIGTDGQPVALDERDGCAAYLEELAQRQAFLLRWNDGEEALPDSFKIIADDPQRQGWLPGDDPRKRRFLDIGVGGFAVIRLIRDKGSRLFTPSDERTSSQIVGACAALLGEWRARQRARQVAIE